MAVVTINFPDRGLLGIHGVPAPCGRVCFRGGEVPHGAKLDAAYTVAVNHDGNSYRMYCHFGVEYLANRRRLVYYFQNEGLPQAKLYDLGWLSLERAAISKMYSWILETVQKYCKKYGLDYKKLLAEVSRQVPLGDDGFTAPGYHIVKRKDKPSRERWRGEKGEILGGAFFLDNPKINFKDCDYCGVRNVRL